MTKFQLQILFFSLKFHLLTSGINGFYLNLTPLGLRPRGTIFVLFAAVRKKVLSYEGYQNSLGDLVKAGFRMSDEVYLEAVRLGRRPE